jgi:hypothetical protein
VDTHKEWLECRDPRILAKHLAGIEVVYKRLIRRLSASNRVLSLESAEMVCEAFTRLQAVETVVWSKLFHTFVSTSAMWNCLRNLVHPFLRPSQLHHSTIDASCMVDIQPPRNLYDGKLAGDLACQHSMWQLVGVPQCTWRDVTWYSLEHRCEY